MPWENEAEFSPNRAHLHRKYISELNYMELLLEFYRQLNRTRIIREFQVEDPLIASFIPSGVWPIGL